jgi:hypothetical protein
MSSNLPTMKLSALILFLVLSVFAGCEGNKLAPDTCGPCGAASLVCTGTVASCIEDGGGTCTAKIGDGGTLELKADGSFTYAYVFATASGTDVGIWKQAGAVLDLTVTVDDDVSQINVYEDGAGCLVTP